MVVITGAVEGLVDEAVVRRLVQHVGAHLGSVYGKNGKVLLHQRIGGYNDAARIAPWIVLVDLNFEADCAPPLRAAWLPNPAQNMCFRVAVREVESWLLADRERLAQFLGVATHQVPRDPEELDDPKDTVIQVARRSRRREIREDMAPRGGTGRVIGPAYTSRLVEFVGSRWRPQVAARSSESLRRAIRCLKEIVNR